jgi:hypothetical protein
MSGAVGDGVVIKDKRSGVKHFIGMRPDIPEQYNSLTNATI